MLTEGGCPPMINSDLNLIDNHPPEMKNNCYAMMDKIHNLIYQDMNILP